MLTGLNKCTLLKSFCILYLIFQIAAIITDYLYYGNTSLFWLMSCVLAAIVNVSLYLSYQSHTKNVMKTLLGASLILLLAYEMDSVGGLLQDVFQYGNEIADAYSGMTMLILYCTVNVLALISVAAINIVHYFINSTHSSSPDLVKINTYLFIFYVLMIFFRFLISAIIGEPNIFCIMSVFFGAFSDVFTIGIVIIIEQSLDEFRIRREMKEVNR